MQERVTMNKKIFEFVKSVLKSFGYSMEDVSEIEIAFVARGNEILIHTIDEKTVYIYNDLWKDTGYFFDFALLWEGEVDRNYHLKHVPPLKQIACPFQLEYICRL